MFKKVKNALRFKRKPHQQQKTAQPNQSLQLHLQQQIQEQTATIRECEDYQVQVEDSLFGIALKYDMSAELLKRINHLSSDQVFPGMVIKVFKNQTEHEENIQENSLDRDEFEKNDFLKLNQIPMYYCMDDQNVKGQLSVREDMILFNTNQTQYAGKRTIYNSCISLKDINEAKTHILPNPNGQKDFIVQLLLSGVGRETFEKKFRKKLQKMKKQGKSIATVFFRHQERDEQGTLYPEEIKRSTCDNLSQVINELILSTIENSQTISLTKLPYIDLIDESNRYNQLIQKEHLDHVIGKRMGRVWASIAFVPQYKVNSLCLSESLYKQLIELLPAIYRLGNWKINFSIDKDGSSYEQLLISMEHESPFIVTVKDKSEKIFGAYVSSSLESSQPGFHGGGETFLFEIKDMQIIPYYWKETNTDFLFCQKDGFGVGCGPSFGLYIDSKLYFGYSNPCTTFENPRFSEQEKFYINNLEFWTLEHL